MIWTTTNTDFSVSHSRSILLAVVALLIIARPAIAQNEQAATRPVSTVSAASHPLDPAINLARASLQQSQQNVRDYTAILTKRVRVDGELSAYQFAAVKIRNRRIEGDRIATPMSVYLKFLKPDSVKGREVIWVEGRNKGQLVAHETGLKNLFRVYLDPNGSLAMRGQRYPITEVGIEKLAEQLIERGNRDRQYDECQVDFFTDSKLNGKSCRMVQIVHPVRRTHFDFYRAQVFFDNELKLPVRYASWSWPVEPGGKPVLEEEYNYTDIKLNVGLTDVDFDPDNSEYNF